MILTILGCSFASSAVFALVIENIIENDPTKCML